MKPKEAEYKTKEVSKIACVHKNTVMNWIKSKKLIAYKKGGQWRVKKSELIKFLGGENGN